MSMFAQHDAYDQQSHVAPALQPPVRVVHSSSARVEATDPVALAMGRRIPEGVQAAWGQAYGVEAGRAAAHDATSLAWEVAERDTWGAQPGQRFPIRPDSSVDAVEAAGAERRSATQPILNQTLQTLGGVSVQWPEGPHTASTR